VIVATGYDNAPFLPAWPGRERFHGQVMHSREYKNAAPFQGREVLVVGPGCSGMEIAYDLAEGGAKRVWLSARTPPNILLRVASRAISFTLRCAHQLATCPSGAHQRSSSER
jgi:cation diffusion facilitator CzcD-associated flavoprotein CzcO